MTFVQSGWANIICPTNTLIKLSLAIACLLVPPNSLAFAKSDEPSIARLNYAGLRKKAHCTAVLIGKEKVLTARHCVDKWPTDGLRLVFGYSRGEWLEVKRVKSIHIHKRQDLAVLCMKSPSKQKPIALFPKIDAGQKIAAKAVGYPRSRAHAPTTKSCELHLGKFAKRKTKLKFGCSLEPGMSGSPVFASHAGQRKIIAIASQSNPVFSFVERVETLPSSICDD